MHLGLKLGLAARRGGGGAPAFDETGLSLTPDYWIDATNGNDSNDGSEGSPWASLNKIEGITGPGGDVVVRVKSDTYDTANDYFEIDGFSGHLKVVFESGCVMDGTVFGSTAQNPIYAGNTATVMTIFGNGLIIQDYSGTTGGTPNGLGYGGAGTILTAYDVTVRNCQDGVSGHTTGHGEFYRIDVAGCIKLQVANIDTSTANFYDSVFSLESAVIDNDDGLQLFERCQFTATTADRTIRGNTMTFRNCQIGTTSVLVEIVEGTAGAGAILVEDSFVCLSIEAFDGMSFQRCFGLASIRVRASTTSGVGEFRIENCILQPSPGDGKLFFATTDFGGAGRLIINDNIFFGSGYDVVRASATVSGYLAANGSQFYNNLLTDSKTYDADLISASVDIQGTVTDDPLIGDADSLDPDDYGYGDGSPAIGAATDGGNIGFAVGELSAVGPAA